MSVGEKLYKLRRENEYTQEQLAEILGVSRQAVSKWESDITYPETDKLIKLAELYDCSLDYLLKDGDKTSPVKKFKINDFYFERKSKREINGLPLWHINIGWGRCAKGIFAIGLAAKGIVSLGVLSVGLLSFGVLSVGLLALGSLSVGLLAFGAIALGLFSVGAISVGVVSIGALSVGEFSVGALSIGKYFASGDNALAMIAIGKTKATGSVFEYLGTPTAQDITYIKTLLDETIPSYLNIFKEIIKLLI